MLLWCGGLSTDVLRMSQIKSSLFLSWYKYNNINTQSYSVPREGEPVKQCLSSWYPGKKIKQNTHTHKHKKKKNQNTKMLIIRKGNQREEIIMAIGHSCHIIYIFRHQDRWTMMVTKSSKLTKVQSSIQMGIKSILHQSIDVFQR